MDSNFSKPGNRDDTRLPTREVLADITHRVPGALRQTRLFDAFGLPPPSTEKSSKVRVRISSDETSVTDSLRVLPSSSNFNDEIERDENVLTPLKKRQRILPPSPTSSVEEDEPVETPCRRLKGLNLQGSYDQISNFMTRQLLPLARHRARPLQCEFFHTISCFHTTMLTLKNTVDSTPILRTYVSHNTYDVFRCYSTLDESPSPFAPTFACAFNNGKLSSPLLVIYVIMWM